MIKEMIITYDTDDADSECDSPILKRQELVRCKNCKYYGDEDGFLKDGNGKLFGRCNVHNFLIGEDYFCADGERKTK